jgi:hypothetical protein
MVVLGNAIVHALCMDVEFLNSVDRSIVFIKNRYKRLPFNKACVLPFGRDVKCLTEKAVFIGCSLLNIRLKSDFIRDAIRKKVFEEQIHSVKLKGNSINEIKKIRSKFSKEKINLDEINSLE